MLERYALTLSTCARCVELKPVVGDGGVAGASGSRSRWNSDLKPAASPEPPPCAAVGLVEAGAPSLGSGAGVGSGMVSALAAEVSATMPNAAPTNSPRPMPAMVPSPASPPVGSRPVWREDDEFWQKALEPPLTGFSITLGVLFADENFALPGVVGLADHAFLLHALHKRSRPVVADLQPALDVAGGGFAVAHDDLHRLLVEVAALGLAHAGGVEHRFAVLVLVVCRGDGFEVLRRALRFEMADDLLDLLVRAKRSMHAADASAAGHVEHVAWPSSCSAPCSPKMVRLSILEVTWNEMRVGKLALIVPVMTSTDGRCVARITCRPAARAIWARRCTAPSMSLPATIIRSAISSTMTTTKGNGSRSSSSFS